MKKKGRKERLQGRIEDFERMMAGSKSDIMRKAPNGFRKPGSQRKKGT